MRQLCGTAVGGDKNKEFRLMFFIIHVSLKIVKISTLIFTWNNLKDQSSIRTPEDI